MNKIGLDFKKFIIYSVVFIAYLYGTVLWLQNTLTHDHFSSVYQSRGHVHMKETKWKIGKHVVLNWRWFWFWLTVVEWTEVQIKDFLNVTNFFVTVDTEKGKRHSFFVEGLGGVKKWSKRLFHCVWHVKEISLPLPCACSGPGEVNIFPRTIIYNNLRVQLFIYLFFTFKT